MILDMNHNQTIIKSRINICSILTQSATQTELVERVNSRKEFGSNNAIRKRGFHCFEGTFFVLL